GGGPPAGRSMKGGLPTSANPLVVRSGVGQALITRNGSVKKSPRAATSPPVAIGCVATATLANGVASPWLPSVHCSSRWVRPAIAPARCSTRTARFTIAGRVTVSSGGQPDSQPVRRAGVGVRRAVISALQPIEAELGVLDGQHIDGGET